MKITGMSTTVLRGELLSRFLPRNTAPPAEEMPILVFPVRQGIHQEWRVCHGQSPNP